MIEIDSNEYATADESGVMRGGRTYRVNGVPDDSVKDYVMDVCRKQLFEMFPANQLVMKRRHPVEVAPGVFDITIEFDVLPTASGTFTESDSEADTPAIRKASEAE